MRRRPHHGWLGLALAALPMALACGEDAQPRTCQVTGDCPDGEVCLVSGASGTGGTCAPPPFGVELRAPAPGARVGVAGLTVEALITLASDDGALPDRVNVVVDGGFRMALPYASRDGRAVTYRGVWRPLALEQGQEALWVAAVTAAGALPSDAVLVEVDGAPPVFEDLFAACQGACARDDDLVIYATVREDHVAAVEAFSSLDGFQAAVPLQPSGTYDGYAGAIALGGLPFPWFSHDVAVRVRVRDEVGNEATTDAPPVAVTRKRWAVDLRGDAQGPVGLTEAAVDGQGRAVVGKGDGKVHVVAMDGELQGSRSIAVHAAPSVGSTTTYLASDDGKLYAIADDGTVSSCPASGAVPGTLYTPAVSADPELAYAGGSGAFLSRAAADGACGSLGAPSGKTIVGPVMIGSERMVAPLVDNLSHYSVEVLAPGLVHVGEVGAAQGLGPCSRIDAPLALQGATAYAACSSGELYAVDLGALSATHLIDLPAAATASPALFPDGALLIGTNDGRLHRLVPPAGGGSWAEAWAPSPDLGAPVTGVLVSAPDGDGVVAYAVTAAGALHALDAAGGTVWGTGGAAPLGAFALTAPTIAPAAEGRRPTLVVGSAEGVLYGVVVDAGLDPASAWPKAHHDLRNTGRAGAPLP